MQNPAEWKDVEGGLLKRFQSEIGDKVPHLEGTGHGRTVVNPTPLVDLTGVLVECARVEYGVDIASKNARVLGKFDSRILGGSIKVRPAVQIVGEAIASGKLRKGQTVFEATSGNFGLALGLLGKLGFDVVVLVSRKLQEGVLDELRKDGVKMVNLDIDICPAPGLVGDPNTIVATAVAASVRDQLSRFGLDIALFDSSREEVEELLGRQDAIGLAKTLARIYDGFCPEQYDNELNVMAHETVTGPEIDQQLGKVGFSLAEFEVLSAFGTGGTSKGLSRFIQRVYGRRGVRVVFPLGDQEVAGIRTKEKALGLKFYSPQAYAGQHEVDFEAARRLLMYFASKGYDIGESSALVLYACIQLLNFDAGDRFVVILADGISKYAGKAKSKIELPRRYQVTLSEAKSGLTGYGGVLWVHGMFTPKEEGIRVIASSLGVNEEKVRVAKARDVQEMLSKQEIPENLNQLIQGDGILLVVCMAGGTSLEVARLLAKNGIKAESLIGGISGLSAGSGKQLPDLVQVSRE